MEHYAHSLSKKNAFGPATHHKSVYDDVFGGPPKFGGPTLAPRYEDYGEIFSGFHSSSRGLSIPVLDLPILDDDEAEEAASFDDDVRSGWFDYSQVFGGYHDNNNDFAVSFEDLVRRFDQAVDYSSDDAWSPVQSESFSDELDPSVCSTNADSSSGYIPAEFTKFHTSYYKTNQRRSGEISIGVAEEPHLNDISGHGSYIGKSHVLQEQVEPPETIDSGDHETDDCDSEKTIKSFAQNSKSFVTIDDISLRTKPCRIPPPSRPPPLFAVKKGTFGKANSSLNDSNTCGFERGEGSHSPPFYDVEVDVNNTTYCRASSSMDDDVTQGTHATEGIIGIHSSSEEETIVTEGRSTVFDKEKCGNKLPHKFKGTFAWRQETEYFEVVETDLPSVAVVHDKDGYISIPYRSDEYNQVKKAGNEVSDFHNIEPSLVARKHGEKNEQQCLQETRISDDHVRQSVETMESSRVKDCQKKLSLDESYEIVENAARARITDAENEDSLNLWGTNADEIVMNIHEKKANARRRWKSFEAESNHKMSRKDVEQSIKEKPEAKCEKRLNQNHEKAENETNPKKSCDVKKVDENIKEAYPYCKIDTKNRQSKMVLNLDKNEDHIEMAPVEFYEENDTHVADVSLSAVTMEDCDENTIRLSFDRNYSERSSRVHNAPVARNEDAFSSEALDQGTHIYKNVSNSKEIDTVNEEMHETILPQKLDKMRFRNLESTPASISKAETIFQTKDLKLEEKSSDFAVEEDCGKTKKDLQPDKLETSTEASCSDQRVTDSKQAAIGIGTSSTENDVKSAPITCDPVRLDNNEEQREKIIKGVRLNVHKENAKNDQTSEVASSVKGSKTAEREERCANELLASEKRMRELRLQKEREFESEKLRKLEEEREREREREKDRMAIDSSVTYGRQRSVSTRERSEKDSMEFRERYVAEKASMEARLRSERAAVERATAEARQRAFAKTMSEKPTVDVSERIERSVSDKFSSSSRIAEAKHFSESQKVPPASMLRYSYSSLDSGVESESPQRHKARLERYRRTAERAAKALAEKNTRDLIAQKELAERCRLAEHLDVEFKRWSSGKEGNLRALLSTLQYILGPDSGWQPIPLTEVITTAAVKRAYRKATLCVHPDKLQQRGASIQHKYTCEKVFDLLQEAWKTFTSEER